MSVLLPPVHVLAWTLLAVLHAFGGYSVCLLAASGVFGKRRGQSSPAGAALPRIAALVVAHDEERVVLHSVESLLRQRYPAESFRVVVVADHCTDGTARVVREAGADVIERNVGGAEGKTAAVLFGIREVIARGGFDAIAIFDADNHVDSGFLSEVGDHLRSGAHVVQGLVDAKNPGASWVAGSSALGFWAIAALAQAPRERLSLSVPPMGTGFAMNLADAQIFLGGGESLTDDLELGGRVVLRGLRVAFAEHAHTLDEKPSMITVATAQRQRWMQGRWAVAEAYVPRLLRAAFGFDTPGGLIARLRRFDVAVQLLSPSLLFTGVATMAVALALVLLEHFAAGTVSFFACGSLVAGAIYYLLPVPFIARFAPPARVWACYALQPVYLSLSAPLAVTGFLARRRKGWRRTPKGA